MTSSSSTPTAGSARVGTGVVLHAVGRTSLPETWPPALGLRPVPVPAELREALAAFDRGA
jgi:hypothetical protein